MGPSTGDSPIFSTYVPYALALFHASAAHAMASVVLKEDKSPIVHNAYCYPELTTFGPEITKKVLKLDCYISVVAVSFKHDRLHAYT